jgi:hypothetical protein
VEIVTPNLGREANVAGVHVFFTSDPRTPLVFAQGPDADKILKETGHVG